MDRKDRHITALGVMISATILMAFALLNLPAADSFAEESLCAQVKIEIKQELTLERQAFDAHMRINNGLTHAALEDVDVVVTFADKDNQPVLASSDPNNTDALFFIRIDSLDNIGGVDGSGTVAAQSSADIHWLIIPSPGASNGLESGTLYYVGATLTYTVGGEVNETVVTPDYIYVKPMPELVLDYFLPEDVFGDDAFTPEIEPSIPFSLGVRVKNNGQGAARKLKIDSAQPKIVENNQGLLIGFHIEGTEVNGAPVVETLLADFGEIAPQTAGTARWVMTCTLSGKFISFDASFTHSDELGGKLTSLIDAVNTHTLVQDVLVDLAGRDAIRDYLAKDGDVYRVYESDGETFPVVDQSDLAGLQHEGDEGGESRYSLTVPVTAGFFMVKLPDPTSGAKVLKSAVRSDGKIISLHNAWQTQSRKPDHTWEHFVCLFDADTANHYTLVFADAADMPQPPVLQMIPDRKVNENSQVSFLVEASDPNGTIPALSAAPLPAGASFMDQGDGTAIFDWTPYVGQKGSYTITYSASDGELSAARKAVIRVYDLDDVDQDGMLDTWELLHFGTLDRDGTGDFDGDEITDLDEFLDGTDPTVSENAPSTPEPLSPLPNEVVTDATPQLTVANSTDAQDDPVAYEFEVYDDPQMTNMVAGQQDVAQGHARATMIAKRFVADLNDPPPPAPEETTNWTVPDNLPDNRTYYWRVRSGDGKGSSYWAYWHFFVNTVNEPPGAVQISAPADGSHVDATAPFLAVLNGVDPDQDVVTYAFEIYEDDQMLNLVTSIEGIVEGGSGTTGWQFAPVLTDGAWYWWRAVATDEYGAQTSSPLGSFYVNTANAAPTAPAVAAPVDGSEVESFDAILEITNAGDADGDTLDYFFEIDTVNTFDSPNKQVSGPVAETDTTTTWHVSDLLDNTPYFWRVKAGDGAAESPWVQAGFFVNPMNDAPGMPTIRNPGINTWVETVTPTLSVNPCLDPDKDSLSYRFEIYSNTLMTRFVAQGESDTPQWTVSRMLKNNITYYWRAQAVDQHGVTSAWTDLTPLFVNADVVDTAPVIELVQPAAGLVTNADTITIAWTDNDPDSDARISLYYDTDDTGQDGQLIVADLSEDSTTDDYAWAVAGLEGEFYVYAVIADDNSSLVVYTSGPVTIDHTPAQVTVEPAGGTFAGAVTVTLSSDDPDAVIYYTVDGTLPTPESPVYAGPLLIEQTTTLRCMAVDAAGNTSPVVTHAFTIGQAVLTVQVVTDQGRGLPGIKAYAFTESGAYTGQYAVTDSDGAAQFDPETLADGAYQFRIDYLGQRYWSDVITVPNQLSVSVLIAERSTQVQVISAGIPAAGVKVYLFSDTGAYLGQYQVTDDQGYVTFDLPVDGGYTFRADILGNSFWSQTTIITSDPVNTVALDAGGGTLQLSLQEAPGTPIPGVKMYLFTEAGSYVGQYRISDADGSVIFDVPEAAYKIRADYLGHQFWSDPISVSADMQVPFTIAHQDVVISVTGWFQGVDEPVSDIKTYLFTASGSYTGQYQYTNDQGQAVYHLPQNAGFKVRADYMGQRFWSEEFTGENAGVDIAMADVAVTVVGSGLPQPGVRVYLFSASDSYLGWYETSDENGRVFFHVPEGAYKFRADYQGSYYWSAESFLVADELNNVDISVGGGSFSYQVRTDDGAPITGVKCYVFSETGAYIGLYGVTDGNGEVLFDLADGAYMLRVDYLGSRFWSGIIVVPDVLEAQMVIAHTDVEVTVTTGNSPVPADTKVYLFSESGAYVGVTRLTDAGGVARFHLPVGEVYQFRADILGGQYWSALTTIEDTALLPVALHAGGGRLLVTLQEAPDVPLQGVKMYLFRDSGAYVGLYGVTDINGQVQFEVPGGVFKLRADYLGYQFWDDAIDVTQDTTRDFNLPHQDMTFTVIGSYQGASQPISDARVYLFNATDTYVGLSETTDAAGQAVFHLPEQAYRLRVDDMGQQHWSSPVTWQDTTIDIPMADAVVSVTGAGLPQSGIKVYLFSESGAYLGLNEQTDANGTVVFHLPGGSYKFRADYQTSQYWSPVSYMAPDQDNPVIISVGGGTFAFTLSKSGGLPIQGVNTYVFSESGAYVGLKSATDSDGNAFFDLADGDYQFRADYLGYPFFSSLFNVPATLSEELSLNHHLATITVQGSEQGTFPIPSVKTYLFTAAGSYVGQNAVTDAAGVVRFDLPDQAYKVRVDYLADQFWSDGFQFEDITITLAHGRAWISVAPPDDLSRAGIRVYVFKEGGTYTGLSATTDTNGDVEFILPEKTYKFRADINGTQYWSNTVTIAGGQTQTIPMP